jgi:hypothetical protein
LPIPSLQGFGCEPDFKSDVHRLKKAHVKQKIVSWIRPIVIELFCNILLLHPKDFILQF